MEFFKPLLQLSIGMNKPSIKTNDRIALEITRLRTLHISSWSNLSTAYVNIAVALLANIPTVSFSKQVRRLLLLFQSLQAKATIESSNKQRHAEFLFIHYYDFLLCYAVQGVTRLQIKAQQKQRDVTESSRITRRLKQEYTPKFWRSSLSP